MKNVVVMLDIDLKGSGRYSSSRTKAYKYSKLSWEKWCDRHNVELFVLTETILPPDEMAICWQRYFLFDLLEANDIKYDQVAMVDCDTIIHPDTPNFFKLTEGKYCGVHNDGSYDWVLRSIENYSKYLFKDRKIQFENYINGGFQIVNKKHKEFFKGIIEFYNSNKDTIQKCENTFHTGTDQTPLNFLLQSWNIDVKVLPYEYNMQDMARKEILNNLLFTQIGYIYHFNAIPNNVDSKLTNHFMERTYEKLYG